MCLGEDGVTPDATKLSPYRLGWGPMGNWTLVGRSSLHRCVRTFSIARILRAELTEDPYAIPPRFSPSHESNPSPDFPAGTQPLRHEVVLRLSPRVAPEFLESPGRTFREVERLEDGGVVVRLASVTLDDALTRILPLADQVEVLAPRELRCRLAEVAACVARRHGTPEPSPRVANSGGGPDLLAREVSG